MRSFSRIKYSFSKEQLRKIYLKKRVDEIAKTSSLYYTNLKQNLQSIIQENIKTIGSYIFSTDKEIIPPLLDNYKQAFPFFEPKQSKNATPLMEFKEHHYGSMYTKRVYGIKIPEKNLPTVYPQIILVPLMCFNTYSKQRVGYGGGYYDQYIRHCRQKRTNTIFVGIGFECLKQSSSFSSQNDQPLDYVITQKTIY